MCFSVNHNETYKIQVIYHFDSTPVYYKKDCHMHTIVSVKFGSYQIYFSYSYRMAKPEKPLDSLRKKSLNSSRVLKTGMVKPSMGLSRNQMRDNIVKCVLEEKPLGILISEKKLGFHE